MIPIISLSIYNPSSFVWMIPLLPISNSTNPFSTKSTVHGDCSWRNEIKVKLWSPLSEVQKSGSSLRVSSTAYPLQNCLFFLGSVHIQWLWFQTKHKCVPVYVCAYMYARVCVHACHRPYTHRMTAALCERWEPNATATLPAGMSCWSPLLHWLLFPSTDIFFIPSTFCHLSASLCIFFSHINYFPMSVTVG